MCVFVCVNTVKKKKEIHCLLVELKLWFSNVSFHFPKGTFPRGYKITVNELKHGWRYLLKITAAVAHVTWEHCVQVKLVWGLSLRGINTSEEGTAQAKVCQVERACPEEWKPHWHTHSANWEHWKWISAQHCCFTPACGGLLSAAGLCTGSLDVLIVSHGFPPRAIGELCVLLYEGICPVMDWQPSLGHPSLVPCAACDRLQTRLQLPQG